MPANCFNGFTEYGVGIGLRIPHYQHILSRRPVVDWFEIISENYMIDGGRPMEILDQILEQYKVVQHGVSMYFGSADPLSREHLKRLKALVRRTNTPWLSDHLCWGSVDGRYTHDLLPMPYTWEAVEVTAQKIRQVQDFVEVPVVVENVSSYAEFHVSEMTEWEFLTEVVERGGPYWENIRVIARKQGLLSPADDAAFAAAALVPRKLPTEAQAARVVAVRNRCEEVGALQPA